MHGISKESKISQRIVWRDGGPVQGQRPYTHATAGVGSGAGDGKKKKKHRKGKSSGQAARGTKGQAGALGRDELHDRRARDKKS